MRTRDLAVSRSHQTWLALLLMALGCTHHQDSGSLQQDDSGTLQQDAEPGQDTIPAVPPSDAESPDAAAFDGEASDGPSLGWDSAPIDGDALAAACPLTPVRLRVEHREAPLGVQSPHPRLSWELQSSASGARGEAQSAYEILVASAAAILDSDRGDLLSTGWVGGDAMLHIYTGTPMPSLTRAYWKVRVRDQAGRISPWSASGIFTTGLAAEDWQAQWIGGAGGAALPLFRREFSVGGAVSRALLAVCGLGQFELRLNGHNVSDAVMEPSWTHYAKECQYALYDITEQLVQGPNTLGVLLGNGMYNVQNESRYTKFAGSFGVPKLIARVHIEYADATADAVVTDLATWRTTAGPITFSQIFGGEDFDARAEPSGWDQVGFDDSAWEHPTAQTGPALVARSAPPMKVMQDLAPQLVTQPTPGVFVYDLGQNFAGWPELTVIGKRGAAVRLTPGELLDSKGLVNQASMGGGPISFSYVLKGNGTETWHPRFTYTGFRYLQLEGAVPPDQATQFPDSPRVMAMTGKLVHAAAEKVGDFSSSDRDLNRVHALILAALRSNLQNVLTDCPHREKLGWLETSQLLATSLMFNHDLAAFYEKIIRDMRAAQTGDGLVPNIAPEYVVFDRDFRDSPEWGSALVIDPWRLYQMYGDEASLREHYPAMKKYLSYLQGKATQGIIAYGLGDWVDVGPGAPGVSQLTTLGLTATATWLQDLQIMQRTATLLGEASDAQQFQTSLKAGTDAFNARFLDPKGYYDRDSQTANAMPLALGLVPDSQRPDVVQHLLAAVTKTHHQVTSGDVGFVYLLEALSQAGRGDLALAIAKQSAGPGYMFQLAAGATALTEAWDANPTLSQNHAMLGHLEQWLYNGLGGIEPARPGWQRISVRPQPQPGIEWVDVRYHSIRGQIASRWQHTPQGIQYTISVPVNAVAAISIPASDPSAVTESGLPAASAAGVVSTTIQSGQLLLEVGSGDYRFLAP